MQSSLPHLKPLTAIRGVAAFWVFLSHCQWLKATTPFFSRLTGAGYLGVDVFFILSGFILSYVHIADFVSFSDVHSKYKQFLCLRLARIYPLHIFALCIVLVFHITDIFGWPTQDNASMFFSNLLLLQSTGWFGKVMSWNLVSWSISVEWMLYLLFPLFACAVANKFSGIKCSLLLVLLPIIGWAIYFHVTKVDMTSMFDAGRSMVRGVLDFLLGVGLYNLYRNEFLKKMSWDAIAMAVLAAVFLMMECDAEGMKVSDVIYITLFAVLVYALAHIRGVARLFFANKAIVYLGTISYSFYMLHWIIAVLFMFHFSWLWGANNFFLTWPFALLVGTIMALSSLCYHFVETPARIWLRQKLCA